MQEVSGSIPLTSTSQRGTVHRLGVISVWLGILATAVGLVVGFTGLATGDEAAGATWLNLVPLGFTLMIFGIGATQLTRK